MIVAIDVSKATLEVSVSEGPVLRFENSATGIRGCSGIWSGQV